MIPPFYIGQRVVAVRDSLHSGCFKKGDEKIVFGIIQMPCGCWCVDVGDKTVFEFVSCSIHKDRTKSMLILWASATAFAPITSTFQTISYSEVLEKEKEFVGAS